LSMERSSQWSKGAQICSGGEEGSSQWSSEWSINLQWSKIQFAVVGKTRELKFAVKFTVKGREQSTEQSMEQWSKGAWICSQGSKQKFFLFDGREQSMERGSDKSREREFAVDGMEQSMEWSSRWSSLWSEGARKQ